MITKKATKNNPKATTKKGYDLKNIKTKSKTSQPKKEKSNALNNFFSVVGFVGIVGGLIIGLGQTAHANQGTFITEPFSCSVALADLKELQRAVKETPKSDFKYKIFLEELEAVKNNLKKHSECSAKGGK